MDPARIIADMEPARTVATAALTGLLASILVERMAAPRSPQPRIRPAASLAVLAGVFLLSHVVLTLVLGRPWFAAAIACAGLCLLVAINNAKHAALREPFVYQDLDYLVDALRYPRFYFPHLGLWRAIAVAAAVAAAASIGLWIETALPDRWRPGGPAAVCLVQFACGLLLARAGYRGLGTMTYSAAEDLASAGFVACLVAYGIAQRASPTLRTSSPGVRAHRSAAPTAPHLVAVQSESFFDPRSLGVSVDADVLANFDRLQRGGALHGTVRVPAWGADTVRSEFAFLSGIDERSLGVHRFNPYRKAEKWRIATLANGLKALGYRTVCIHPFDASYYRRDRVIPALGFDEFIDVRAFPGAERCGDYVSDAALAAMVLELVRDSSTPVFVFAITMECHGPWPIDRPADGPGRDGREPEWTAELRAYLRHLRNADGMLGMLCAGLERLPRAASLCWYGDHVPMLPSVYRSFGYPGRSTDFLVWQPALRTSPLQRRPQTLELHELGLRWAELAGREERAARSCLR